MDKLKAIIVAGGTGIRMQNTLPKQFIPIHKKPIIQWTLEIFANFHETLEIIIVIHQDYIQELKKLCNQLPFKNRIIIVAGGKTRYHSVKNGVAKINNEDIVFVHDAVRCMLHKTLLKKCLQETITNGIAIPAIAVKDSIRIEENNLYKSIDRNKVKIMQTPQTFKGSILKDIFTQPYQETFTDEATLAEKKGYPIHLIDGDIKNIKITYPIDLIIAEALLKNEN